VCGRSGATVNSAVDYARLGDMRIFLPAFIVLLLMAGPATGQGYHKGLQAFSEADYSEALEILGPLAEQGHTGALYHLGLMHESGYGVPRNGADAIRLWQRGAARGDVIAQETLGDRYRAGRIVPRDYTEAMKWYRAAAGQGSLRAMFHLGTMYRDGEGVTRDAVEAYVWFSLAEARGSYRSGDNRKRIARQLTEGQLAEANRRAEARWEEVRQRP
jgi:uncharacterized protein